MTFWQQFTTLFFTSLIVPIILLWVAKKMKEAEALAPKRRLNNRELREEHGDMLDAFKRIRVGLEDYDRFMLGNDASAAAATIAAVKRDIKNIWIKE